MKRREPQACRKLNRLPAIRDGKATTASGRPIPNSADIPEYCYVICDITETIKKRCNLFSLTASSDKMGYFVYNPNYTSYIEVIFFDQLVDSAKKRNRAFFDKLGLPTSQFWTFMDISIQNDLKQLRRQLDAFEHKAALQRCTSAKAKSANRCGRCSALASNSSSNEMLTCRSWKPKCASDCPLSSHETSPSMCSDISTNCHKTVTNY